MKKLQKQPKIRVKSKKRASKIAQDKTLGSAVSVESLKLQLGANFGKLEKTGKRNRNQWFAETADKRNNAYGSTDVEALQNLLSGIANRI